MILRSLNKFEDTFDGNIGKWDTKTIYIDKKTEPIYEITIIICYLYKSKLFEKSFSDD